MWSPSRFEVKASRVPSGDHRGVASRFSPEVKRRGGPDPSEGASQTAPRYSLASLSTRQMAKATVRPSGDTRGSSAPASSYTSSGVMPDMLVSLPFGDTGEAPMLTGPADRPPILAEERAIRPAGPTAGGRLASPAGPGGSTLVAVTSR